MKCLFVHDHKFPKYNGDYYESPGFDVSFFERYKNIFGELSIFACEQIALKENVKGRKIINEYADFHTFISKRKSILKEARKGLYSCIKKSDYVVIRLPSFFGLIAARFCEKTNKPYLLEIVGCPWDAVSTRGIIWKIPAFFFALMTKKVVKKAKYCVYVTQHFLEKRYPTRGKYINCSNVTLENYGTCNLEKRKKRIRNIDTSSFTIGTCASLDTIYKGQDDVFLAIKNLKKIGITIKYQLAGGGNSDRLKRIIEKLEIQDSVEFVGELSHKEVFEWLDTLDIYVHPSKQEGLSRAIIESMSRACPIFAADAGGVHEQIDEECIFKKGDAKQMVYLLSHLDKDRLLSYSMNNYERAKQYQSDFLYKKRKDFFKSFIINNNSGGLAND